MNKKTKIIYLISVFSSIIVFVYYFLILDRSLSKIKNQGYITLLTTLSHTTYFKYQASE